MRVLAIDPGTNCGYAIARGPTTSVMIPTVELSGVWNLKPNRHEGGGMRFPRLRNYLKDMDPNVIVYEEVRRHLGTDAAHIYGGIIAEIGVYGEDLGIPYTGIPVGTVKKHATGKGNASKADMLAAAKRLFGPRVESFDQADALHILNAYLAGLTL